jgi:prevent-host-death family protein
MTGVTTTKISSREFNQDTSGAKRAANDGPVYITDRGRPSHVLLSFDDYRRLSTTQPSIVELLAGPCGVEEIEFAVPTNRDLANPAHFD